MLTDDGPVLGRAEGPGRGAAPHLHGDECRDRGGCAGCLCRGAVGPPLPDGGDRWRRAWTHVIPFFAFPPAVRCVIDTTNALESVHARIRKIIKTRGHFPDDDAATKLIWLAVRNITADWTRPVHHWKAAMNQFAILYEDRFTRATT